MPIEKKSTSLANSGAISTVDRHFDHDADFQRRGIQFAADLVGDSLSRRAGRPRWLTIGNMILIGPCLAAR